LSNVRLQWWVVIIGIVLLIAKSVAFLLTNSNAILTDALESIVNVIAGLIGLFSLSLSAKPRDADHPYGHGKIEFISASIEGALVFFAGIIIIGKSVYSFFYPHPIQELDTGIIIVLITGIANYSLGYVSTKQGQKTDSLALVGSGQHLKSDAYSTFGIIVALILIRVTGFSLLDNLIAAGFGIFICITGYRVLRKAIAGIMDEADYDLLKKIISKLNKERREEWMDVHNMRVIKYGHVLHIDCHLTVPWYFSVQQAHGEVDAFDRLVKSDLLNPVELFIHTDPCVPPKQCRICLLKKLRGTPGPPLKKELNGTWKRRFKTGSTGF
jgi:cation diffusion facilitator family transporter